VVDDDGRRGSLLGVEQLLEHSPQLMTSLLAESPGNLVLEVLDGGQTGFDEEGLHAGVEVDGFTGPAGIIRAFESSKLSTSAS
jgi:hypothetical protein